MRLFVAVWPSPDVLALLDGLDRSDDPAVRWTSREQWHITLRFLGEVPEDDAPGIGRALQEVAASQPRRQAELGPATVRLGRRTLVAPMTGLDELGAAVVDATRAIGADPGARPFRAHLTLARSRGDRPLPRHLAGQPVRATWPVDELTLVRSHLDRAGARYETITSAPLTG